MTSPPFSGLMHFDMNKYFRTSLSLTVTNNKRKKLFHKYETADGTFTKKSEHKNAKAKERKCNVLLIIV